MKKEEIINTLKLKSYTKQVVYDNTKVIFKQFKNELQQVVEEYNEELKDADPRLLLEYRDRGMFEAEIKVAGDLLVFNMHSNIFEFDNSHPIWKDKEAKANPLETYAGIISVYNFLADSFKYNRLEDVGYLVGRIFINANSHFFIEGQKSLGYDKPTFFENKFDNKKIKEIIENIISFALIFDLYVPPVDNVKMISVGQIREKINKSKIKTGKRLGFEYNQKEQ